MTALPSMLDLAESIRNRDRSSVEVVQQCLNRIEAIDPSLECFRETYPERSLKLAMDIDSKISAGDDPGPLAGVPIALKDNIATNFGRTSCGSRFLQEYESPFSSTVAARLELAGAIIIGKTNCDEFAMGSSTEHCAFAATKNPWDPDRVPGGSSGGSAAAVAAGLCPASMGSDTGGSIRQPASFCGVVGVKPSYGRVSRYGLVAFGSSLDQVGPLTTNVRDAAAILKIIAGVDRSDSTSADIHVPDYLEQIDESINDLRIAVPRQSLGESNDPAINRGVRDAMETYRQLGAEIVEVDLSLTDYAIATYYIISAAEASANLARFDGIRFGRRAELQPGEGLDDLYGRSRSEGFGPEVQRRIMLGTHVLSSGYYDAYYKRAMQVRRLVCNEYDAIFENAHAILGPTSPFPAFIRGEKQDPMSMYHCDIHTVMANIAGICAISIPGGQVTTERGPLPIGLQIQCKAFDESTMFRIARLYEKAHPLPLLSPSGQESLLIS